ncbi:MAG: type II toxin-antitoxin system RelE/ParE family toxin [Deltaproteobacteria bacterium]|nr:type II toxin-antitoxin system RelE/ParE family toxin [Deltaproteobacteria bacterium]
MSLVVNTAWRYACLVIQAFGDKATEDIFNGINSREARRIPRTVWPVVQRKLDMLNAATDLRDLTSPPGNRLEALRGNLAGKHSIRVNDQYRIVFRWMNGNAYDVVVTDYH